MYALPLGDIPSPSYPKHKIRWGWVLNTSTEVSGKHSALKTSEGGKHQNPFGYVNMPCIRSPDLGNHSAAKPGIASQNFCGLWVRSTDFYTNSNAENQEK